VREWAGKIFIAKWPPRPKLFFLSKFLPGLEKNFIFAFFFGLGSGLGPDTA
jgi:hypothetical protein